jgi:hypothetical protein
MHRRPEDCPFRSNVCRQLGGELATCALIEGFFPGSPAAIPIKRELCEHCCRSAQPEPSGLNDVVASQVYLRAQGALDSPGSADDRGAGAAQAREVARSALLTFWSTPNRAGWTGTVYNLASTTDVIDGSVSAETFAGHLSKSEPFAYLRYGDGEWLSILGEAGRNADNHDYFPETLGLELRGTLQYAAGRWPRNDHFYMGLHGVLLQDAIRRYVVENGIAHRIRWVSDNLFALGFFDMSTYRFLQVVKDFQGPKILAGNESLAPVAEGLSCQHVVVPLFDCYREIDLIQEQCRFRGRGLLICCAGMASECLICRAHQENPDGSYVDCGHIFDSLVGNFTRNYTQGNWGGINDFLAEHYAPLIFDQTQNARVTADEP